MTFGLIGSPKVVYRNGKPIVRTANKAAHSVATHTVHAVAKTGVPEYVGEVAQGATAVVCNTTLYAGGLGKHLLAPVVLVAQKHAHRQPSQARPSEGGPSTPRNSRPANVSTIRTDWRKRFRPCANFALRSTFAGTLRTISNRHPWLRIGAWSMVAPPAPTPIVLILAAPFFLAAFLFPGGWSLRRGLLSLSLWHCSICQFLGGFLWQSSTVPLFDCLLLSHRSALPIELQMRNRNKKAPDGQKKSGARSRITPAPLFTIQMSPKAASRGIFITRVDDDWTAARVRCSC